MSDANIFQRNARHLRELNEQIEQSFAQRDLDEKHRASWMQACARFHSSFDQLAFPGGLQRQLDRMSHSDPEAIELAVRFLEADPWFFRSGYIKEQLLRILRRVVLTEDQQARLRAVILHHVEIDGRREFRRYCQLARVLNEPSFRKAVVMHLESDNGRVVSRARLLLRCLAS